MGKQPAHSRRSNQQRSSKYIHDSNVTQAIEALAAAILRSSHLKAAYKAYHANALEASSGAYETYCHGILGVQRDVTAACNAWLALLAEQAARAQASPEKKKRKGSKQVCVSCGFGMPINVSRT